MPGGISPSTSIALPMGTNESSSLVTVRDSWPWYPLPTAELLQRLEDESDVEIARQRIKDTDPSDYIPHEEIEAELPAPAARVESGAAASARRPA